MLETSLTTSIDVVVEGVELTPVVPSIEVMTEVVSESSSGSSTWQMGEVPGDVSTFDETLGDTWVLDDGRTQRCHQLQADLLVLKGKATLVREAILLQNEELEDMRVVCAKSAARLGHIGEWLDSLMV